MTNGSEGSLSGLWSWGVTTALGRGWNAFIYDGPAAIAEAAAKDPMLAQAMAARGRPFGKPTAYDTFKAATEYNLRNVVTEIRTPMLITNPDDETFWPGQSQNLYDNLTGEREITHFLREDGANFHCEPMGRAETECRIFDFLQDQLDQKN